ncbi:MAG: zinc-dependent metalloprotease [Saprospiraceae bacterium]
MLSKFYLFSLLLCCLAGTAVAQSVPTQWCGTPDFDNPWLEAFQRGEIAEPRNNNTVVLPLRLHIVGRTNGTGYLPLEDLLDAMCLLQEDFVTTDILFYIDGDIDTINNDTYYNAPDGGQGGLLMAFNNDPNVINCYFVNNPTSGTNQNGDPQLVCGYFNPQRDGMVMSISCTNGEDHTWGHEMGHFLSLPHTFRGWEGTIASTSQSAPISVSGRQVEMADGSNCSSAGDGFCDTPADYLSERWTCNSMGESIDSLVDPMGVKFKAPGWPIMGYANDECVDSFSTQQSSAMRTNAQIVRSGLILNIEPQLDSPDGGDIELLSPANANVEDFFDDITLSWSDLDNADFYVVQISRSSFFSIITAEYLVFDTTLRITEGLDDDKRYYWRVQPLSRFTTCPSIPTSATRNFRTGLVSGVSFDEQLEAAVTISPNPVGSARRLFLTAANLPDATPIRWELYDMSGRLLQSAEEAPATALNRAIDLNRAPAGIYSLRITQGRRLLTRRVVVQ